MPPPLSCLRNCVADAGRDASAKHLPSMPGKTDIDNICFVGWRWVGGDVLTQFRKLLGVSSYETFFIKHHDIITIKLNLIFKFCVVRVRKGVGGQELFGFDSALL